MNSVEPNTVLKSRAPQLIQQAHVSQQPIVITQNGGATAVLMDTQAYERQRQALHLLTILSQGDQAYLQGRHVGHTEARRHFRRRLGSLRSNV